MIYTVTPHCHQYVL